MDRREPGSVTAPVTNSSSSTPTGSTSSRAVHSSSVFRWTVRLDIAVAFQVREQLDAKVAYPASDRLSIGYRWPADAINWSEG